MMIAYPQHCSIPPPSKRPASPAGRFYITYKRRPQPGVGSAPAARPGRHRAAHLKGGLYAPTIAEPAGGEELLIAVARPETAAATRSQMRVAVKPTSSCSSAGLPWVT